MAAILFCPDKAFGSEHGVQLFDQFGIPRYSLPHDGISNLTSENQGGLSVIAPQLEIDRRQVSPGTELILETGESFILQEVLGAGFYTIVLRDSKNRVIRLARHIDKFSLEMNLAYLEAHLLLGSVVDSRHIVQVSLQEFASEYVTVVELLAIRQRLDLFLAEDFDPSSQMYRELLEFLEGFRRVSSLGSDFLPKQIGYVAHRGWVLFDLSPGVKILNPTQDPLRASSLIRYWSQTPMKIGIRSEVIDLLKTHLNLRDRALRAGEDPNDIPLPITSDCSSSLR